MGDVNVFVSWNDEGKFCEFEEGSDRSSIIKLIHKHFCNRGGGILQELTVKNDVQQWVNCSEDFVLTSVVKQLRLLPTNEKRLGLGKLAPATSLVFCCDMQERFKSAIKYFEEIVAVGGRILKAAQLLDIPIIVTEQYPRGLGKTVPELDVGEKCFKAEKTKFSMLVPAVEEHLEKFSNATSVVLFGVEAHVCVQQTVLDLVNRGFDVHIVADATSSRSLSDRQLAFERLRRLGAFVTSCETVLLQWVADKQHDQFKPIQNLIKELPPSTGLTVKSTM